MIILKLIEVQILRGSTSSKIYTFVMIQGWKVDRYREVRPNFFVFIASGLRFTVVKILTKIYFYSICENYLPHKLCCESYSLIGCVSDF